ncbi:MAG: glutamine-hydrolyzing carbamoyl-phosphate synthase small subunit [Bdellovibrionales bacterium]|nr:glutamine-hydrolyzing carbamoyl-phosphate synthase small subunit [Bdellovibrionales bacterium]
MTERPKLLRKGFSGKDALTPGKLVLADGRAFPGMMAGAVPAGNDTVTGEVVFNTSMYGYQEILSDPSYAGQMMSFTYPHIGNVGCNTCDMESHSLHPTSVVVRSLSIVPSNYRSEMSFPEFLLKYNRVVLSEVDTRALTTHIRDSGAQMGAIGRVEIEDCELQKAAISAGSMEGQDLVSGVTCSKPYSWGELVWDAKRNQSRSLSQTQLMDRPHVVAVDCGVKFNILRLLVDSGFRVTVVPATCTADEILAFRPDGIFLSNGPGDPAAVKYLIETVQLLLGQVPIFGICLGHQILALACGGNTFKLKFGHRGANHPVKNLDTGRVEITTQNHGFAVRSESLPNDVRVTHKNLNDDTVAGLEFPEKKAFCVQFHPEASSGPHDSRHYFDKFFGLVVGSERLGIGT